MSRFDDEVPADREPTLRDRTAQLEKLVHSLMEQSDQHERQIRDLQREVGMP